MKIKTKIEIIIVSSIVALAVISGLLYLVTQRAEKESLEAAKADELVKEMSEFNILVFEYMLHHEERPRTQARLKYDSIARLLKREEFEYPEEQAILAKIRQNYEHIGYAFSHIIAVYESPKFSKKEIDLFLELEQRLQGSILLKSQQVISDAFNLAKMIREKEDKYRDRVHLLIFMSLAVIFGGIVSISVVLLRGIIRPITMLHKGTEIIGSGNLDYKVGTNAKDEIGQLSRAFDTMAENLKKITITSERYRSLVENPFVGVYITTIKGNILYMNEAGLKIAEYDSLEDFKKTMVQDLYHDKARRDVLIHELKTKGSVNNFEIEIITKKGNLKTILINSVLEGDVLSGMMIDITEKKQWEEKLTQLNKELEQRLQEIKTLRGILPICSYCKKIRNDKGYWEQLEMYIRNHSEAEFSHGMCDECAKKAMEDFEEFKKNSESRGQNPGEKDK